MNFDWYPWYTRDFKRDTLHLTLAQDGAYRRLIDEYMENGGALPDSDAQIARLIGVDIVDWMGVAEAVREFFESSNGKLVHKRCEEELHTQRILRERRSDHARHAIEARWAKHRERQAILRREYPENTPRILNHTTRQSKIDKKEGPTGFDKPFASPELIASELVKGWKGQHEH